MRKLNEFDITCERDKEKELLATDSSFRNEVETAINYLLDQYGTCHEYYDDELHMLHVNLRPLYEGTPHEDCLLIVIDRENPEICLVEGLRVWRDILTEEKQLAQMGEAISL